METETTSEQHLQQMLSQLEKVPRSQLPQSFKAYFDSSTNSGCSLEDFAIYFLAAVRQHTELHFRNSASNESETPQCATPVKQELNESQLSQLSLGNVSTPVRQGTPQGRRSSGSRFCSTPQSRERSANRSACGGGTSGSGGGGEGRASGGGGATSSFCLGDFMLHQSQQRSKKKNTPQHQDSKCQQDNKSQKPRRRVLPMTISKNVTANSSFGDTSSFSNENNLWRLSQSCELLERSQSAALDQEARQTLLLHKQQIKSEAPVASVEQQQAREDQPLPTAEKINLKNVKHAAKLELLAGIYAQLIDLNLVPNVLSELSYVLQLLNVRVQELVSPDADQSSALSLLGVYQQCIYFAAQVLEQESLLLLRLDCRSLTVLLQHERLSLLPKTLTEQLATACQNKQQWNKGQTLPEDQPRNVYYQQEKDSRDNFPTMNEFNAFKTQRDLFYKALKQWEHCHLNRTLNVSTEMRSRIRDIFRQSEHAVNMSHFAKLFVSQLLMSSGQTHESAEELGLKLDQQRLNRLAQRLFTSNSSVEDQFPRTQAFFRDFINECGSMAFLVQLQLALYVQLLRHNDSSFELLQLQEDLQLAEEEQQPTAPYIVRPQALAEMLLLAKFLGYVCALPYNRSPNPSASVQICPQQVQLRRQFQPPFEMRAHLERATRRGKLLITLPWLVQYLIMLDLVTLQMPDCLATLELLYDLYAQLVDNSLQPCAAFITRSCLGWLLESQSQLSSAYYSRRRRNQQLVSNNAALVKECLHSLSFALKQGQTAASLLEQLLPVACPFLHEFRVAITPSQRQTQRSGRFRYITTRLEQLSTSNSSGGKSPAQAADDQVKTPEQQQRQLRDAFLHSQNASMRRLLEFVVERSFKCVVKDAQQQILLPSKLAADAQVNAIGSIQQQEVQRELHRIYQQARAEATKQWAQQVPGMLEQRIEQSLQALLPANTNEVVRGTYANLIRQQAQTQLQQWLESSVLQSSFYHGDLKELASKVCRANKSNAHQASAGSAPSNELCLPVAGDLSLSELLHELQQWLHCLSMRPEHLAELCELLPLLQRTQRAAHLPQLPSYFYQLLASMLVRLLQLLICRQPQLLSSQLIHVSCEVWRAPQLRGCDHFDTLLSINFVQELGMNLASFHLLEQLLHDMLEADVFHIDELNQLFMPLFKENWTPPIWSALSELLQQLSENRASTANSDVQPEDDAKSHLFMEMLADLSRDLDSF